jgi:hypothetical protein
VLKALPADEKLVVILDELPVLLHKMWRKDDGSAKRAMEDVLDWLRSWRMRSEASQRLRQILGGSIGLPRVASLIGASAKLNDLQPVRVWALEPEQAGRFSEMLLASRGVAIGPQAMTSFLAQVETHLPFLIQIMAASVASAALESRGEVTPELIAECYEKRALGPEYRTQFEDYYERLARQYSPSEARAAKRILGVLSKAPAGLTRSTLLAAYLKEMGQEAAEDGFNLLLAWLTDDFYVGDGNGRTIDFRSRWIKNWWRRYHGTSE